MPNFFDDLFSPTPTGTAEFTPIKLGEIEPTVKSYSDQFGVDFNLSSALIQQESGGDPSALSGAGAVGLMQIMPGTAKAIAEELGEEYSDEKLKDPDTNIRWGTYHLKTLLDKFGGDELKALAGYHAGEGAVRKAEEQGQRLPESYDAYAGISTKDYVKSIMSKKGTPVDYKDFQPENIFEGLFEGQHMTVVAQPETVEQPREDVPREIEDFAAPVEEPVIEPPAIEQPVVGTTEGLPPALAQAKPLPEEVKPPPLPFERIEPLKTDIPKETVALTRGLVAEGVEAVIGVPAVVSKLVSGIGSAVDDFIQTGDPETAVEGFKQGFQGERDVLGKSAKWWEEKGAQWGEAIKGEAKTKGEEFQQKMASDMLNAYFILAGGTAILKALPKTGNFVKTTAQGMVNKAKLSSKVLKNLKLTEDELRLVKQVHQGFGGKTVKDLTPRTRAFYNSVLKDATTLRAKALRTGEIRDIVSPWEAPKWGKVKKGKAPLPKRVALPTPEAPLVGKPPGVVAEKVVPSNVDDMVENLLAEGGIYTKEMIRKGRVPVSEKVITPTKETKFVSKGIAEVAPRRIPTEAELATLPKGKEKGKLPIPEKVGEKKGQPVFRASKKPFDVSLMGEEGVFVSPDKAFVERWAKSQNYKNVEKFVISDDAKILKREDIPDKFFTKDKAMGEDFDFISLDRMDEVIKYAKDNGYDGVEQYTKTSEGKIVDPEIAIWNPDKIKPSKITPPKTVTPEPAAIKIGPKKEPVTKEFSKMSEEKIKKELKTLESEEKAATRSYGEKQDIELEETEFASKLRQEAFSEKRTVIRKGKVVETTGLEKGLSKDDWAALTGDSTAPRSREVNKKLQGIADAWNTARDEGPGATALDVPPESLLQSNDNWSPDDVANVLSRGMNKKDFADFKKQRELDIEKTGEEGEIAFEELARRREAIEGRIKEIKKLPKAEPAAKKIIPAKEAPTVKPKPKETPPISEAGFIQLPTMDVFKTPKQKVPEAAKKIHEKWVSDKQVQLLESDRAINKLQQQVKGKEREVIPFLIERTGIPKELNRPDLEKILKDPTKKQRLTRAAEESKKHMNEVFQYVKKHRPDMSEYEVENYVTHIWDIPKNKVKDAVNWFTTYDPFLKKRFIQTLAEGIKRGYKPKTLDITKIMKIHDQYHIKTTENIRLVEALKQLQDKEGMKLIQRADRAPVDWITSDHPVLRRALYIPGDPAVVSRVPVKYHPDLDPLMKSVFGKRITATPIQIYEAFNGVMKQTQLSLSLFHHAALTETAVATIGPVQTAKILGNVKGLYNALARNKFDIYEKKFEVAKDGVKHGLQIGAITDVQRGLVTKMLEGLEDKLNVYHKGLGLPARVLRKGKELWDKGLWDYLHNNFKVYAYENLKTKSIVGLKNPTDADITVVKKEVAQMVNDTFGGQNWERMMTNPRNLQIAQWALLSPDWTFSTVRQALAPTGIGRVAKEGVKLRRKMGAAFWARAAFYFYGGVNMLNFTLSKYDNAKERGVPFKKGNGVFMWQNDPGHKTHLMVGRYPDGSKRYIRWGKQFRELPELFYDQTAAQISPITATLRKLGSKAAPNLQLLSTIFTGKSIGGFKNRELANKTGWTWVGAAAKEIIKAPLPFAFKNTINESKQFKFTDLAFPSSKGMTYFKAKKLFKIAVVKRNLKYVANIYKASVENNLNANDVFTDAITELKREATAEVSRKVRLGKITEPATIKELKALTRNERRELERKVMLENWEILMLSAEERYQKYLIEKELEEEPFVKEK